MSEILPAIYVFKHKQACLKKHLSIEAIKIF